MEDKMVTLKFCSRHGRAFYQMKLMRRSLGSFDQVKIERNVVAKPEPVDFIE